MQNNILGIESREPIIAGCIAIVCIERLFESYRIADKCSVTRRFKQRKGGIHHRCVICRESGVDQHIIHLAMRHAPIMKRCAYRTIG
ncbi:hypothetical protein D3C72_2124380 [compost metagenome]